MLTYEIPDRSGSGLKPGRQTAFFDFVVAQRPRYIPNSGPPLAPISIMPADDKTGFIVDVFQLEGAHVYLVGFKDNPHLQMSVRPENIRKYVSDRTHEQWDFEQSRLREEEERRIINEQKKPKKKSRVDDPNAPKGKPGRKRKRGPSPAEEPAARMRRTSILGKAILPNTSGPGRRRQQPDEEVAVFASPKSLQKSQGPSLVAPVKGLAETTDLETDEEDSDSAALEAQLIGEIGVGSTMPSKSPTSRGTSRASSRGASLSNDQTKFSASNPKTIAQKYTNFPKKTSTPSPLKHFSTRPGMFSPPKDSKSPIKSPYQSPAGFSRPYGNEPEEEEQIIGAEELSDEQDSEEEYEVDCILKDEMRTGNDGKRRLYYLIKWEGDWDDTWEPAINVGEDPIKVYKEKKRKERRGMGLDGAAESDGENELFVSGAPVRGQVIDDEIGDLSD